MKKLLVIFASLIGLVVPGAAFPITGYIQISTGPVQSGGFSTQTGTVGSLTDTGLAANQCVQTSAGGLLMTTGASCSAGGGNSPSTLQVTQSGVQISSPTPSMNFFGSDFSLQALGSTASIVLNPNTTDYVHNTSSLQSGATLNLPTGTIATLTSNNVLLNGTSEYITGSGASASQYWGNAAGNNSAQFQVCLGFDSCLKDTQAGDIAIGNSSLSQQMANGGNTAIGFGALDLNSCTNNQNATAVGYQAMSACTGGAAAQSSVGNTAVGYGALNTYQSPLSGNTVIGAGAAGSGNFTSGYENTLVGANAGEFYTTNNHNTAIGAFADSGSDSIGNSGILNDICIGHSSCSGGEHVAGNQISSNTLSSIFIGYNSGLDSMLNSPTVGAKAISKSFAIGYESYVGCSNCGVLGPNAGQYGDFHVGIDTNTPTYNLEVHGSSGTYTSSLVVGNLTSGLISSNASGVIGTVSTVSSGVLPSTVAYTSINNNWTAAQTASSSFTVTNLTSTNHLNCRGSAPGLSTCGATPSITGTDCSGKITEGTGSPTGCVVTFNQAYGISPYCIVQTTSTITTAAVTAQSNSQFTITTSATIPSDTITYHCFGGD